jgi:hypothetical protein
MTMWPPSDATPGLDRLTAIENENRHLQERLRQAALILDIQEKTLELFGEALEPRTAEDDTPRQ